MKGKVLFGEDKTQIKKQAGADNIFISEDVLGFVKECNTVSKYRTDHSGVTLQLRLNQNER